MTSDQSHNHPNPVRHWFAHRSRLARWSLLSAAAIIVVILIALALLPLIGRSIIRHEIQVAVAGNLNATLVIDDLSYSPLLSVSIGHARLVTPGPNGGTVPVAELAGLHVSLAHFPLGAPIVVENLTILDPVIDLVRLPSGDFQIQDNLFKPQPASSSKLSDLIRVRHLAIQNLAVREKEWNDSGPPRPWATLDVQSNLGNGPGTYDLHLTCVQKPLGEMKFDGSADIDGTTLTFKHFSLTTQVPPANAMDTLPPQIAALCRHYGLAGHGVNLTISDGATIALDLDKNRWSTSGLRGDVKLTSAPGAVVTHTIAAGGEIAFDILAGGPLPGSAVPADLGYLKSLDQDTRVSITTDSQDPITFDSPTLMHPLTGGQATVIYSDRTLLIKDATVRYGPQQIHLDAAAAIDNQKLKLQHLQLAILGGTLTMDPTELTLAPPYSCSGSLKYDQMQLSQLKDVAPIDDPAGHLSGRATGTVAFSGPLALRGGASPLQTLAGNGELKVQDGDFWDIPVFGEVVGHVIPSFSHSGRVGQAAAVYTYNDGTLHLSHLVVSSPLIGIQGSGDVGMLGENPLNLNLTAAPLADLKKQVNQTGIPLIGQAFGGVQQLFNRMQKALYAFHVTGPAAHPQIEPIPAPGLTAASKDVFSEMLKGAAAGSDDLLNLIKPQNQTQPN